MKVITFRMSKANSSQQQFLIYEKPTLVNKERVYPNKGTLIKKADDQFYIYNLEAGVFVIWTLGLLAFIFGFWVLSMGNKVTIKRRLERRDYDIYI